MDVKQWERIVVLHGIAGQVILLGYCHEHTWFFKKEEDPLLSVENPLITNNFQDALRLLGHSWSFLTPTYVHPQFKQMLWHEVKKTRSLTQLASWRLACI